MQIDEEQMLDVQKVQDENDGRLPAAAGGDPPGRVALAAYA